MSKSVPGPSQAPSKKNLSDTPVSLKPRGKSRSVPSPSPVRPQTPTVDTLGPSGSRLGAQAPPTGTDTTTPQDEPTTCETCDNYLQSRRTALLPHIGRHVVRTGQRPSKLVDKIRANYHRLGHRPPPGKTYDDKIDATTQALHGIRRLAGSAKKSRP